MNKLEALLPEHEQHNKPYQLKLTAKGRSYKLVTPYTNNRYVHGFECTVHKVGFLAEYHKVVQGRSTCPVCNSERLTEANKKSGLKRRNSHEHFVQQLVDLGLGDVVPTLRSKYKQDKEYITRWCDVHGEYSQLPSNTKKGNGCPYCAQEANSKIAANKARLLGLETLLKIIENKKLIANTELIQSSYKNQDTLFEFYCPKHQHTFESNLQLLRGSPHCCPIQARKASNDGSRKTYEEALAEIKELYGDSIDYSMFTEYVDYTKHKIKLRCVKHNKIFYKTLESLNRGHGCPLCSNSVSKLEQGIREYMESLIPDHSLVYQDRKILSGLELDIWIPEHKLAIEVHGLRYHSELKLEGKNNHHHRKYKLCEEKGIRLIQIWEDEWRLNNRTIKALLKRALSKDEGKIGARNCSVVEIDHKQSKTFLDSYHIQGFSTGQVYYGLFDKQNELVGVGVFGVNKSKRTNTNDWEMIRYATSKPIIGGLSKLVKHHFKQFQSPIFSYSDNMKFTGESYLKAGFVLDKELGPDYTTTWDGHKTRKCKSSTSKSKLKKAFPDVDLTKTEHEICLEKGIYRLYDAGKKRWVYKG